MDSVLASTPAAPEGFAGHLARSGAAVELPIGPEHPMYGGWQPRT